MVRHVITAMGSSSAPRATSSAARVKMERTVPVMALASVVQSRVIAFQPRRKATGTAEYAKGAWKDSGAQAVETGALVPVVSVQAKACASMAPQATAHASASILMTRDTLLGWPVKNAENLTFLLRATVLVQGF